MELSIDIAKTRENIINKIKGNLEEMLLRYLRLFCCDQFPGGSYHEEIALEKVGLSKYYFYTLENGYYFVKPDGSIAHEFDIHHALWENIHDFLEEKVVIIADHSDDYNKFFEFLEKGDKGAIRVFKDFIDKAEWFSIEECLVEQNVKLMFLLENNEDIEKLTKGCVALTVVETV